MSILKKKLFVVFIILTVILSGCGGTGNSSASQENSGIKVEAYNVDDYVSLGEYKGIEVETLKKSTVTDQDVENVINSRLEEEAKYEVITDRDVIQKGDYVLINTIGKKDGVVIDGKTDDYEYYEVGSGGYVDGIEEALVGKKPGLPFDITVEFPKDYVVGSLAGQKVDFTIMIKSINKKIVSVLNDEYVQKKSQKSKTVAEYKEEVRKQLQDNKDAILSEYLQLAIVQKLIEKSTVSGFPKGMIEKMTEEYKENLLYMAQEAKKSVKDYIKDTYNMDEAKYAERLKEEVETDAKKALILEAIEKKENLTMTAEERNKAIDEFATENGYASKEKLLEEVREDDINSYVQQQKVLKWLIDNAKIVEPKSDAKS